MFIKNDVFSYFNKITLPISRVPPALCNLRQQFTVGQKIAARMKINIIILK